MQIYDNLYYCYYATKDQCKGTTGGIVLNGLNCGVSYLFKSFTTTKSIKEGRTTHDLIQLREGYLINFISYCYLFLTSLRYKKYHMTMKLNPL